MVVPNDTSSVQVTSDESANEPLASPISTERMDIEQDMRRRPKDYAKYKIQQTIGEYTVTCDRDLVPARAKYLYNEKALARRINVSYDLNQGFDAYMEKEKDKYERRQLKENNVDERLDSFWKWIINEAPKGSSVKEVLHDADIVCCRGLLKRIALTAYNRSKAWEFSAIRFNDVIFLCEQERHTNWHQSMKTESRDLVPYWYRGFKFEQYMTVNKLSEKPRTDGPVTREEHVVVFRSTLGPEYDNPLKLVFNGSIDAIKADGKKVELKTRRYAQKEHFVKDFSCYLQSFLVGIVDTYVGYHHDNGIVTKVEHVPTWTLPYSQGNNASADLCMHLLSNVLNSIRSALQDDGEACKVRYAISSATSSSLQDDEKKRKEARYEFTIHPASLAEAEVDFSKNTNFREYFNLL